MSLREYGQWLHRMFARQVRDFAHKHGGVTLVSITVDCPICGERHTVKAAEDE